MTRMVLICFPFIKDLNLIINGFFPIIIIITYIYPITINFTIIIFIIKFIFLIEINFLGLTVNQFNYFINWKAFWAQEELTLFNRNIITICHFSFNQDFQLIDFTFGLNLDFIFIIIIITVIIIAVTFFTNITIYTCSLFAYILINSYQVVSVTIQEAK